MDVERFLELLRALSREGVDYVLVEGVPVRLATPATLYRMKKGTVRPIDQADAAALREKFGIVDE